MNYGKNLQLVDELNRRYSAMEAARSSFLPHWQLLSDWFSPRQAYINGAPNDARGDRVNRRIIDPTGTNAHRILTSGLMAGMTNPARPWFKPLPSDIVLSKSASVKAWSFEVESIIRETLKRSNFYTAVTAVYSDCSLFGTTALLGESDEESIIRFFPLQIGTYMLAVNHHGRVDTLYRKFNMTARQMVNRFGRENCSQNVLTQYDNSQPEVEFEVIHVIEPNQNAKENSPLAKHKRFSSVYYEVAITSGQLLEQSGYDEFPVFCPRWDVFDSVTPYGYSPAMDCLGLVKGLQTMHDDKYLAIQRMVRPSLIADSVLRGQIVNLEPDYINYVDGMASGTAAGVRRVERDLPNIEHLLQDIQDIRQMIDTVMMKNMMISITQSDDVQKTAREIEERHAEKILVLGPTMERFNDEFFDSLIIRVFNECSRRGKIPPPPPEMEGVPMQIKYTSILAQAAELVGIANIDKQANFVMTLASAYPEAAFKFDPLVAIDTMATSLGINPNITPTNDDVAVKIEQMKQQQKMQQMAQMAQPVERAAKAGKAFGETDAESAQQIINTMMGR